MRFDRLPVLAIPIAVVIAGMCVGEVPPAPQKETPSPSAVAFREQRLEWTDDQVSEVVVSSPPWQEAVQAPAPAPVPEIPPGGDGAPSAVLATGIPETAMASYTGAADSVADTDSSCGLPWSVIAAIGRVESNHGRYGGARLHTDGSIRPVIRGIALDGRPGVAVIGDSDGGGLDGDRTYDRAVGPMQFIPSTWRGWASDGNNDGVRDPDNMFDAALAAARYLCAGDVDIRTTDGLRSAIFRYNHSQDYVSAVVSIATAYRDNVSPVIPDPAGPESPAPAPAPDPAPVEVTASTEAPVVVTTTPPTSVEQAPSTELSTTEPTTTEPSTTESTKPPRPVVCTVSPTTVSPTTDSAPPWVPVMPVVTCKPQPSAPKPETTPTPTPSH